MKNEKAAKTDGDVTRQLLLVHLSDLHFGKKHRFNPPAAATGEFPKDDSYPTLAQTLLQDLRGDSPEHRVIVCCTGDFTETGSYEEFKAAEQFLNTLASKPILGRAIGKSSIFLVPGNHDVLFTSPDMGQRWQQWTDFYNRVHGSAISRDTPHQFAQLADRVSDLGALILTINSAIYVEKGKPDEQRGRLDEAHLNQIEEQLRKVPAARLKSAIRIALVHHHPVLIPALAEPGRGYDAVHNSGSLLRILRRYGFHLVLHGHKHYPHVFTEDATCAFHTSSPQEMLIVAGGSAGSTELPEPAAKNSYNQILIKWHPAALQCRIVVETRSLEIFHDDRTPKLASQWRWQALSRDDRQFVGRHTIPEAFGYQARPYGGSDDDSSRKRVYERARGNMPVVEVMPSLIAGQAYEARFWIVGHKEQRQMPKEVIWSAGPKFPVLTVSRDEDPNFCACFNYWGPMLIQATLVFEDGARETVHIYARLPRSYGKKGN